MTADTTDTPSEHDQQTTIDMDTLTQLSDGEVVRCENLEYGEVWFYEYDAEADRIYRYHSSTGFQQDTHQDRPRIPNSLTTDKTDVEIVDVEELEQAQRESEPAEWRKFM